MDLEESCFQPLVQLLFEQIDRLVADAALDSPVDEVLRPVEDDSGAYQTALHHRVEIVGEWLFEQTTGFFRKRIVRRGHLRQRLVVAFHLRKGWLLLPRRFAS